MITAAEAKKIQLENYSEKWLLETVDKIKTAAEKGESAITVNDMPTNVDYHRLIGLGFEIDRQILGYYKISW